MTPFYKFRTAELNRRLVSTLIVLVLLSAIAHAQPKNIVNVNSVKTENGLISGKSGTDPQVMVFEGIPYAAPPVGNLRWKEPQPVQNWQRTRQTTNFGANCMQGKPVPFGVYTAEFLIPVGGAISEDCLYLNVWTTGAESSDEKKPVIVFIHGGALINGSGSVPIYNGEAMAKKGVVFVTINYRLGVFGFLAHPELTREPPHHASGNYGIFDQIAALKWVKKNIAAFGGNPDNVTIAGQSAGAMSVNTLAATPLARGLFHKMIAESGAYVVKGQFGGSDSLQTAESKGADFARKAGAASLKDLRSKPAVELVEVFKGIGSVNVDGYLLPESIPAIFAGGREADVPLLTGYDADDIFFQPSGTLASYSTDLKKQFGSDAAKIMQLYPAANDEEAKTAAKNLSRDMGFGLENYAWIRMQSEKGSAKNYMYFFERRVPEFDHPPKYGAFHTGEVMYAYDTLKFLNRPLEKADAELAKLMSAYWVNFAASGNPNAAGLPAWTPFSKEKGEVMRFNTTSASGRHPTLDGLEYFYQKAIKPAP